MIRAATLSERRCQVIRKTLLFMVPLAAAGITASQWRDMIRYLKIKRMSAGSGHPENVPAAGSQAYPKPCTGRGTALRPVSAGRHRCRPGKQIT